MKKKINFLCVMSVLLFTSGCANYTRVDNQLVAEPDRVALQLATAVDRATVALQTLAAVEQARNPSAAVSSVSDAPYELKRTVSVDWTGPVEPIVQRLANRAGYKFSSIGDVPPVPVIVSIVAVNKSIIDVLRDVGLQAGLRASIIVDAEHRTVEVSYAPITGS